MSASTQNQALAALLFLYRKVLGGDGRNLERVIRARKRPHLHVVLRWMKSGPCLAIWGEPRLWWPSFSMEVV